jgi:hypothetical protein
MSRDRHAEGRRTRFWIRLLVVLAGFIIVVFGATVANAAPTNNRPGRQGGHAPLTTNYRIAAYAKTFVGRYPYVAGGSSPATGFDCSGLTHYIYRHYGRKIRRTAEQQYDQFRRIAHRSARPGDLVFFHDRNGYVFHVGVYEGSHMMVAAATPKDGIRYQRIWSRNVTYGTITHSLHPLDCPSVAAITVEAGSVVVLPVPAVLKFQIAPRVPIRWSRLASPHAPLHRYGRTTRPLA